MFGLEPTKLKSFSEFDDAPGVQPLRSDATKKFRKKGTNRSIRTNAQDTAVDTEAKQATSPPRLQQISDGQVPQPRLEPEPSRDEVPGMQTLRRREDYVQTQAEPKWQGSDKNLSDLQPILQSIADMVKHIDSKQQVHFDGLMSKVTSIEDQVAHHAQSQIASLVIPHHGGTPVLNQIHKAYQHAHQGQPSALAEDSELMQIHRVHQQEPGHKPTIAGNLCDAALLEQVLVKEGGYGERADVNNVPRLSVASRTPESKIHINTKARLMLKISVQAQGDSKWRVPTEMDKEVYQAHCAGDVPRNGSVSSADLSAAGSTTLDQGKIKVEVISAQGLPNLDRIGKSDPYCICEIGKLGSSRDRFQTAAAQNTTQPHWGHPPHTFKKCRPDDSLHFVIKDRDMLDDDETLASVIMHYADFMPDGFHGEVEVHTDNHFKTDLDDDYEAEDDEVLKQQSKLNHLKSSIEAVEEMTRVKSVKPMKTPSSYLNEMSVRGKDATLDMVMVSIILLNAVVIGLSMDYEGIGFFAALDVIFTCAFLVELALKWRLHGILNYFRSTLNCLDFGLICVDLLQLVLTKFIESSLTDETPPAAVFRVARLVRLVRLLRVVRLEVLDDLVAMISGLVGGMSTLMWAIVLFILFLYVTSLLFREFFGRKSKDIDCSGACDVDITLYFNTVPRAMLTVFRYFFGDFSTAEGINLFEGIQTAYGAVASSFVSVLFFMMSIGVFNVIAAIFVERTLDAAMMVTVARKTERMNDQTLWSTRITTLIHALVKSHGITLEASLSECLNDIAAVPVTEHEFANFIAEKAVVEALDDLEIDSADHKYLFDILDNDNTGSIYISQLVDGVRRLRGDPRRSDIITIDLMVRAIQEQTNMIVEGMETVLNRLTSLLGQAGAPGLNKQSSSGSIGDLRQKNSGGSVFSAA